VNYRFRGTVEFVAGQDKSFFFLEMTRGCRSSIPDRLITASIFVEQMIRVAPERNCR